MFGSRGGTRRPSPPSTLPGGLTSEPWTRRVPSPDDKSGGEPKFSAWRAFSQGSPPFHFPSFGTLRPPTTHEDRFAWQRGGNTERDRSPLRGASRGPPASKLLRASTQMRGGAAQGAARRRSQRGGAARRRGARRERSRVVARSSRDAARRRGARRAEPRRCLPRHRLPRHRLPRRRSPRAEAQLGGVACRCRVVARRVVARRIVARGSRGAVRGIGEPRRSSKAWRAASGAASFLAA